MSEPEAEPVLFERTGGVGIITLNRPEKLNPLGPGLIDVLVHYVRQMEEDATGKVVILTANGRGFCSGADLSSERGGQGEAHSRARSMSWPRPRPELQPVNILRNSPLPVIGAINGVAAGAGLSLALATDIRIASEQARLVPIFIKRGLQPDMGGAYFLTRALGARKALELIWSGESISAEEALELGLVNQVVPHEDLLPAALEEAERLAKGPSVAIALAKRAVYRAESVSLELDLELGSFAQERLMGTEDAREARRAFLEKREPNFKGE